MENRITDKHSKNSSSRHALPLPRAMNEPRPCRHAPGIAIHDWAGFDAAASWTWDDTQPSQIEHWPALRDSGVPMTFYLNPVFRKDNSFESTWREAVSLGHELGNHTANHPGGEWTSSASMEALQEEIDSCSRYITEEMGQEGVWSFAYPYGDFTWNKALGDRFIAARTCQGGMVKPLQAGLDPLALPIHGVQEGDTATRHNQALDSALAEGSWVILMFHAIRPTLNDWYAGVEIQGILDNLGHARQGGRIWMDTVASIAAYWRGQALFDAAIPMQTPRGLKWNWSLPASFPKGRVLRLRAMEGSFLQAGKALPRHPLGFHEIALDAGSLDWHRQET